MRGTSRTAEIVAAMRVLESRRPDSVLNDQAAARFVSLPLRLGTRIAPVLPLLDRVRRSGLTNYIITRHLWMDRQLQSSEAREVLVLGAGYDTRAVRFPGRRYWEVDHPATAARKRRRSPAHPAVRVDVDFERQGLAERLTEAGFPVGAPTFVIWEGVTMYLSREAIQNTLGVVAELVGPGSTLVFDALCFPEGNDLRSHVHRASAAMMPLVGEPVTFMIHPEDWRALLAAQGWTLSSCLGAVELAEAHAPGRYVFPPAYVVEAAR